MKTAIAKIHEVRQALDIYRMIAAGKDERAEQRLAVMVALLSEAIVELEKASP